MAEAAHLAAVVVDQERSPGQRLIDEPGQYHAVLPDLARADHIEQSTHNYGHMAALMIGERQIFIECLAAPIYPAPLGSRSQYQVIILGKRHIGVFAVHFARAGEK